MTYFDWKYYKELFDWEQGAREGSARVYSGGGD